MVPRRRRVQYIDMIEEPLSAILYAIAALAAGMYPLGFLFGSCSPCCQSADTCQWLLNFDRCIGVGVSGSSPPDGGDFRVSLTRVGSGDVEVMNNTGNNFQIHHVQSEIRVSIEIQVGATGASRTPVGSTRTQVWRLTRATPTSPPATVYDVLGPPWHLQVNLSVTGVGTSSEAGVSHIIDTDEHGQPRLVVQVNQWTQPITHTVVMTLYPSGLQRWGPGFLGTESLRLTTASVLATRIEGTAYSGWSVRKLSGLTIVAREIAFRIGQFEMPFNLGTTSERIFLDGTTAADFVAGTGSITVPATFNSVTTNRDLTVLPDNVLCQLPKDLGSVGILFGVYPEHMTLTVPESFINNHPQKFNPSTGAVWCGPSTIVMRALSSSCVTYWQPSYSRRGVTIGSPSAFVSDFYSGRTLLWNLVQGPYRASFSTTGPVSSLAHAMNPPSDWLVTLGGSGDYSLYEHPEAFCPSGMSTNKWVTDSGLVSNVGLPDFDICTPVGGVAEGTSRQFAFVATVNYAKQVPVVDEILFDEDGCYIGYTLKQTTYSGTMNVECFRTGTTFSNGTAKVRFQGTKAVSVGGPYAIPAFTLGEDCSIAACNELYIRGQGAGVWVEVTAVKDVGCSESDDGNLSISASTIPTSDETVGLLFEVCSVNRLLPCQPFPVGDCPVDQIVPAAAPSVSVVSPNTLPHSSRRRTVCSDWSPSTIPPEGGTVTRTCGDQFGGAAPTSPTLSLTYGESRTRLPRLFNPLSGPSSFVRSGNCRLLTLTADGFTTTAGTTFISGVAGTCYYLKPSFGSGYTAAGAGDPSGDVCQATILANSLPCDGCTPSVSVVSGSENARVRYVQSGIKQGTIELVALRTWLSGEGVTLSVSCGDDTITHTVRRT